MTVSVLATPRVLAATPQRRAAARRRRDRGGWRELRGRRAGGVPHRERRAAGRPRRGRRRARRVDAGRCSAPAREIGAARVAVGARTGAGYTDDDVWYEYVSALPVEFAVPSTARVRAAPARGPWLFSARRSGRTSARRAWCSAVGAGEIARHGEMTCGGETLGFARARPRRSRARFDFPRSAAARSARSAPGFLRGGRGGSRSAASRSSSPRCSTSANPPRRPRSDPRLASRAAGPSCVSRGDTRPRRRGAPSGRRRCPSSRWAPSNPPRSRGASAGVSGHPRARRRRRRRAERRSRRREPTRRRSSSRRARNLLRRRDVAPGSDAEPGGTVLRVFLLGERVAPPPHEGRASRRARFGAVAPVAARLAAGD